MFIHLKTLYPPELFFRIVFRSFETAKMPSRPTGFLSLPRELRDTIYHLYIFEPDGYRYDHVSKKLRTSDNRSIDLTFMYTCKTVATELHNLALGSNVINFSTISTDSQLAYRFDTVVGGIQYKTWDILESLREPSMQRFKTPGMDSKLAIKYPQFEPLLRQPPNPNLHEDKFDIPHKFCNSWGEATSMYSAFQTHMLELVAKDPEFANAIAKFDDFSPRPLEDSEDEYDSSDDITPEAKVKKKISWNEEDLELNRKQWRKRADLVRKGVLLSGPEVWTIPSEDQVAELEKILGYGFEDREEVERWRANADEYDSVEIMISEHFFWRRIGWRFSAAAAAIHFLKDLSLETLLGISKIVLHEDRRSVARPESHAQGLIPYCRQNPQLRIERRVSMWRILAQHEAPSNNSGTSWAQQTSQGLLNLSGYDDQKKSQYYDRHCAVYFGINGCQWITESSALRSNGMPPGSFSLLLDGDPLPDLASKAFEILKDDAAWQIAQMQWYADQSLSRSFRSFPYPF